MANKTGTMNKKLYFFILLVDTVWSKFETNFDSNQTYIFN